jgi:hypothetical protein
MTQRKIAFSKAQSCVDGTRVNPVSSDDFRALIDLLEERKVRRENTPCRVPNGARRDQPRRRQVRPGELRPGTNQGDQDDLFPLGPKSPPP